jgi:hypothetical protein
MGSVAEEQGQEKQVLGCRAVTRVKRQHLLQDTIQIILVVGVRARVQHALNTSPSS